MSHFFSWKLLKLPAESLICLWDCALFFIKINSPVIIFYTSKSANFICYIYQIMTDQFPVPKSPEEPIQDSQQQDKKNEQQNMNIDLPQRDFIEFVGRVDQQQQILERLSGQTSMISVVGLGGLGKTALVRRIIDLQYEYGMFEHVVWTDARKSTFNNETVVRSENADVEYTFESLINEIARQCKDFKTLAIGSFEQRKDGVKKFLNDNKVLIVMDNMETVQNRDEIVYEINQLLGNKSKIIITSRYQINNPNIFTIPLGGLSIDEGRQYLFTYTNNHYATHVIHEAPDPALDKIILDTGGSPLAMRLALGQMTKVPFNNVMNNLVAVPYSDANYNFYRFMYGQTWKEINDDDRLIWVGMSSYPAGTGASVEAVSTVFVKKRNTPVEIFQTAIQKLLDMSIVNLVGQIKNQRYALHQLTRNFARSDITRREQWNEDI